MNEGGDLPIPIPIPATRSTNALPCSITSILPNIFTMSCRNRTEAFARSLTSRLSNLRTQASTDSSAEENNGGAAVASRADTWLSIDETDSKAVTELQPLRHSANHYFPFEDESASPVSPHEEPDYLPLVETDTNTPQDKRASVASSNSSSDGIYYDAPLGADTSATTELKDCNALQTQDIDEHIKILNTISSPDEHLSFKLPEIDQQRSENNNGLNNHDLVAYEVPAECPTAEIHCTNYFQNGFAKECSQDSHIMLCYQVSVSSEEMRNPPVGQNGHAEEIAENSPAETNGNHELRTNMESNINKEIVNENTIVNDLQTETNIGSPDLSSQKSNHANMAIANDENYEPKPQRVRRCSSLKTGKTPPGTPGQKKIVRFADVLGLDLADVKTFLDDVPTIPSSAYEDLDIPDSEPPLQLGPRSDKLLMPLFQQPGGLPAFLDMVREKQVSLENAAVTDNINLAISGTVRVRNLDFHKSVHIRYTMDGWRTYADLSAIYVENSCDGFSDKYSFVLYATSIQIGQRLEFAVRFQCKGQQFWDNNYGANYCLQCLSNNTSSLPICTNMHHTTPVHQSSSSTFGGHSHTMSDDIYGTFY